MKILKYLLSTLLILGNVVITSTVFAIEKIPEEPIPVEKIDQRLIKLTENSVEERYQGLKKIEFSGKKDFTKTTTTKDDMEEATRINKVIDNTTTETIESVPKQSKEQTSDSKEEEKQECSILAENSSDQPEIEGSNELSISNTGATPETKEATTQSLSATSGIPSPDHRFSQRMTTQAYVEKQFNAFCPGGTYKSYVLDSVSPNVELVNGILYIPTSAINDGHGWQPLLISPNFFSSFQKLSQAVKNKIKYIKVVQIGNTSIDYYPQVENIKDPFLDVNAFRDFKNLKKVDLRHTSMSRIKTMDSMFQGCSSLTRVWLEDNPDSFINIQSLDNMFEGCTSLTSTEYITGGFFNGNNKSVSANSMFKNCTSLTKFDMPRLFKYLTSVNSFFSNCLSLENPSLPFTNTLTSMDRMFENTPKITNIDMTNIALDNKKTKEIFGTPSTNKDAIGKPLLVYVNPSISPKFLSWDFLQESGRTSVAFPTLDANGGTFPSGKSTLKYLDKICVTLDQMNINTFNQWKEKQKPGKFGGTFIGWTPSKNEDHQLLSDLFGTNYTAEYSEWEFELDSTDNYYKLRKYIGTNSDVSVPNELAGKPTKIDLSQNITTKNLGSKGITSITFSNKNGGKVKAINNRIKFSNLNSLISFDGSGLDTSGIDNMSFMFSKCSSLKNIIGLDNWDTSKVENMARMFQGCRTLESLSGLTQFCTEKVTDMTAMFQDCRELQFIDLSNFIIHPGTSIGYMFHADSPTPLLVKTKDKTLLNYNYTNGNRYPSGPKFDVNGGNFDDNSSLTTRYYFEKCAVEPTSNKWKVEIFRTFKNELKCKKIGNIFKEYFLTKGSDPTTSEKLVDPMIYTAKYVVDSKIPSQDIDNELTRPLSTYGIAYIPKMFIVNGKLDLSPVSQSIHIAGNFHVGVRDVRNVKDRWRLTAQLQWSGKKLAGEILTTNKGGIIQKNTNNGVDRFQESDLIPCPTSDVFGRTNVVINGTPREIMASNKYNHNSVYDYNLNRVSLRILKPKDIESGNYQGNVIWNLSNTMN